MNTEKLTFEVNAEIVKENERLKTELETLKSGIRRGSELYANLKFDDEPFTPYQLALQELAEVKRFLQELYHSGNKVVPEIWRVRMQRFVK